MNYIFPVDGRGPNSLDQTWKNTVSVWTKSSIICKFLNNLQLLYDFYLSLAQPALMAELGQEKDEIMVKRVPDSRYLKVVH